ncbi:MAG: bile acid:sodium symporter [Opitutales bacterium]
MIYWLRQHGFTLLLFCAVALAFLGPAPVRLLESHWAGRTAEFAVALIFFLQGLSLPLRQMLAGLLPLRLHLFVLSWNFALFPALAVLLLVFLGGGLGPELAVGLWMLSILPTTIASATALTAASKGGVGQAIFASIFSNLVAVFLVPLLAVVYLSKASGAELSLLPVFIKLGWIVLLPLFAGQCLRRIFRSLCLGLSRCTRALPQLAILYIVYLSMVRTVAAGVLETLTSARLGGAICAVALLLGLASWGIWQSSKWMKLGEGQRISAFFTASQKSIATGLPLLTTIFGAASMPLETGLVLVPLLLYHPLQLLLGGFLVPRFGASLS